MIKDLKIRFESSQDFSFIKKILDDNGEDTSFLEYDPNQKYIYYCNFSESWLTEREFTKGTIDYIELQKLINLN